MALASLATGCSDEAKHKAMEKKYNAIQADKAQHNAMSAAEMAEHSGGEMQHEMSADEHKQHMMAAESGGDQPMTGEDIGRRADDLPPPLNRMQSQLVSVDLYTDERIAEMMPGVTYQYWTYNGKVPGPFIRARTGDQVEINLSHGKPGAAHEAHSEPSPFLVVSLTLL